MEGLIASDCDVTEIKEEDGLISVFAPITEYAKVKQALLDLKPDLEFLEDQIAWIPSVYVKLTDENDKKMFDRLMALLDEIEDVQDVYHNIEFDEE